jgi:hypothetical protein
MQRQNTTQILIYIFGISMAFLMAASLIFPALTPQTTTVNPELTNTPAPPTFPPPLNDFSGIQFTEDYLHPSMLFAVQMPSGWQATNNINNAQRAAVNLNNPDRVTLIEIGVDRALTPVETVADLSAIYDETNLAQSWRSYASWTELGRPSEDDRLIIEFALTDRQQRDFQALQSAWTDGEWIYSVRVVAPANARDLLYYMTDFMQDAFKVNEQFKDGRFGWSGTYDQVENWVLRYPNNWVRTDGTFGQPISFRVNSGSAAGTQLRVEVLDSVNVDEDAARSYIEDLIPNTEIVSVEPVERAGGSGYSIAYSYTNFDGEALSGAAVLLNGETGNLYIANALIPEGGIDINDPATTSAYNDLVEALGSFSLLTGLDLPEIAPQATPTPFPTRTAPEAEATPDAESTPEAEATEEAEAMDDAPADEDEDEMDDASTDEDEEDDPEAEATEES